MIEFLLLKDRRRPKPIASSKCYHTSSHLTYEYTLVIFAFLEKAINRSQGDQPRNGASIQFWVFLFVKNISGQKAKDTRRMCFYRSYHTSQGFGLLSWI